METHSLETTCRLVGLDQKAEKVMGPNEKVPDLALENPPVRAHNLRVAGLKLLSHTTLHNLVSGATGASGNNSDNCTISSVVVVLFGFSYG